MTAVFCCVLGEEGWGIILTIGVFALIGIGTFVGVETWVFRRIARWIERGRSLRGSSIEINVTEGKVAAGGFGILIVVGAVGLIVPGTMMWYGWSRYDDFSVKHSVALDTPTEKKTLEVIRQAFQGDTRLSIILSPEAQNFQISGHFSGVCVADLFASICRTYSGNLSCSTSGLDSKISVDLKAAP